MSKTIGIIGGMGPLATLDLFEKIVKSTPAERDQEHIPVIILNNPQIPSRVTSYFEGAEELVSELQKSALLLEKAGASFLIMPCHTSHIWIAQLREKVKIPFYSMIDITAQWIKEKELFHNQIILLLATTATVESGIYQKAFEASNIQLIIPGVKEQKIVSKAINQVKAGLVENNPYLGPLQKLLEGYKKKGISAILGGCTEIPLLFPRLREALIKIDPTLILAKRVIQIAMEVTSD